MKSRVRALKKGGELVPGMVNHRIVWVGRILFTAETTLLQLLTGNNSKSELSHTIVLAFDIRMRTDLDSSAHCLERPLHTVMKSEFLC